MNDWYEGPYRVVPGDSLKQVGRLGRGDIIRHRTGNVSVLRCPACGRTQFTVARLTGSDDYPTLNNAIVCGSGACKSCEAVFTIVNGKACRAQSQEKVFEIPPHLRQAGVKPPPRR